MADTPFLQRRSFQNRGPSDSADYNARVEESYKDLVTLYNRARITESDQAELFRCAARNMIFLTRMVDGLTARLEALEVAQNILNFNDENNVENNRFVGTEFEIPSSSICSIDTLHGLLTLPKVTTSSLSKLFLTNSDDVDVIPGTLEMRVVPDQTTADSASASIDSSDPELSIIKRSGRIWERNVIASSPDPSGAVMVLYVKIPTDLFTTDRSNGLVIHPYPVFSTDIVSIEYTTAPVVLMDDTDNYIDLNFNQLYSGETDAIGWVPPGGWTGDVYNNAGYKMYYFDPAIITGLKITLRQRSYFQENSRYTYSYGLSKLDLRFDKFLSTGKTLIRFDAPTGKTISSIDDVQPSIWNIPEAALSDVFSYRVIWETGFNSGNYTITPVPLSNRVWLEVTLNQSVSGATPALSGLNIFYS